MLFQALVVVAIGGPLAHAEESALSKLVRNVLLLDSLEMSSFS